MAYLTILRTTEDRCEQCGATEHVLRYVMSNADGDDVRLVACLICTVVSMDNAMEWNMSRQFAQALANRSAGEQVQLLAKQTRENLDARLREAAERTATHVPTSSPKGSHSPVRSDSGHDDGASKGPASHPRNRNRDGGTRKGSAHTP